MMSSNFYRVLSHWFPTRKNSHACTPLFKYYDKRTMIVFHAHPFPKKNSSSMFQDPLDISHFNSKSFICNFHNPRQVTWTQNFHRLGKLRVNNSIYAQRLKQWFSTTKSTFQLQYVTARVLQAHGCHQCSSRRYFPSTHVKEIEPFVLS
jgi:hypothetical protein